MALSIYLLYFLTKPLYSPKLSTQPLPYKETMSSVLQNFGSSPINSNKEEEEMIQGSDLVQTLDPNTNLDMILQAAMSLKDQVTTLSRDY